MTKTNRDVHVVFKGRHPGIYHNWDGPDDARQQIHDFTSAHHETFDSHSAAEKAWRSYLRKHPEAVNHSYVRESLSSIASIDWSKIYESGSFKNVFMGTYMNGPREGQSCVAKEFKEGGVYEEAYFSEELSVWNMATDLITRFNNGNFINRKIYINEPKIYTCGTEPRKGRKMMIEPMIENFEKFNSNTGWVPEHMDQWHQVMQALSHYSYHVSGRRFLLCDVQGGIYRDGFVLTDPVIMSATKDFGPTDLGVEGISTFFSLHECNAFCHRDWAKPDCIVATMATQEGTAMLLPPRYDRKALTQGITMHATHRSSRTGRHSTIRERV